MKQKTNRISLFLLGSIFAVLILLPQVVQTLHVVLVEHENHEPNPVLLSHQLEEEHWRCPVFDVDIQPKIFNNLTVFFYFIPFHRVFLQPGEYVRPVSLIRHFLQRGPPVF